MMRSTKGEPIEYRLPDPRIPIPWSGGDLRPLPQTPRLGSVSNNGGGHSAPEFIHQNPDVFRVVYRHRDQVDATSAERRFQRRYQPIRRIDSRPFRAVSFRILNEIGIAERQSPIGKRVDGLFPPDHSIGVVLKDQNHQVQTEAYR